MRFVLNDGDQVTQSSIRVEISKVSTELQGYVAIVVGMEGLSLRMRSLLLTLAVASVYLCLPMHQIAAEEGQRQGAADVA